MFYLEDIYSAQMEFALDENEGSGSLSGLTENL